MERPYRLLFALGAALAWVGVLPWLFFALGLRGIYEPLNAVLAYRSFLHPLAELEGFLGCFAVGLVFTLLTPPPAAWQVALAAAAPLASSVLGALGRWQAGQAVWLLLLAVVLEFALRRRPLWRSLIWTGAAFLMGALGAALAAGDDFALHELGRDLVMQGLFTGLAVAVGTALREDPPRLPALHAAFAALLFASFLVKAQHLAFALRALVLTAVASPPTPGFEFGPRELRRSFAHLGLWLLALGNAWIAIAPQMRRAGLHVVFLGCFSALLLSALTRLRADLRGVAFAAGLLALSMVGRVLVELDPGNFHLWMGLSAASFLSATALCVRLPQSV